MRRSTQLLKTLEAKMWEKNVKFVENRRADETLNASKRVFAQ